MFCLQVKSRAQFNIQQIGTSNGLTNEWVRSLSISPDGTVWAGTSYGLNKISPNGIIIQTWDTPNPNLPDLNITALLALPNQVLWIGTFQSGIIKWQNDTIVAHYHTGNSLLPDDLIRAIEQDNSSKLYITTSGGLAILENNVFTVYNTANSGLISNSLTSLAISDSGKIYIGSLNGGLSTLNNGQITVQNNANSPLNDNTVLDLALDNQKNLWLTTPAAGMFLYTNINSWFGFSTINSNIVSNSLTNIEISGVTKYIGTANSGLVIYNGQNFSTINTQNSNLSENWISSIAIKDSTIWVGTRNNGLNKIRPAGVGLKNQKIVSEPSINYVQNQIILTNGESFQLKIYDLQGRICYSTSTIRNNIEIKYLQLTTGVYIAVLTNPKQTIAKKFFVAPTN